MATDKQTVTFGLKQVLSGEPGVDGTMGTSLEKHGENLKGTVQIETSDETINTIQSEEGGVKIAIGQNDSETTITHEIINPSLDDMAYYLGGAVDSGDETTPASYQVPKEPQNIIKSFKYETLNGYDIEVPYGKVVAKPMSGVIGTDTVMTLQVVVTAQMPEDDSTSAIRYLEKESGED